ncbi:MAG: DUF664 domain-containing protein [Gemmatimonadota bacterium]
MHAPRRTARIPRRYEWTNPCASSWQRRWTGRKRTRALTRPSRTWQDYWPASPAPSSPPAWDESIATYHADLDALKALVMDPDFDLFATVPWGSGQTNIREVVLVVDHTAYHVGQIVLVRRLLGAWG